MAHCRPAYAWQAMQFLRCEDALVATCNVSCILYYSTIKIHAWYSEQNLKGHDNLRVAHWTTGVQTFEHEGQIKKKNICGINYKQFLFFSHVSLMIIPCRL
jgi:hypothetical protein